MAGRKHFEEGFIRSALELADKVTVPIAAAQLGVAAQNIYNWRSRSGAPRKRKASRFWTDEELKKVAEEWVLLHAADPLESPTVLAEKAQRKVLPGERQRDIASIHNVKVLKEAIKVAWESFIENPAPTPPPPPAPPAPEVEIACLEVPVKLTAQEMLSQMDEATLESMLVVKRLEKEAHFHAAIIAIAKAATGGANGLHEVKQFVPRLQVFEIAEKKPARIGIVGVPAERTEEIRAEVKAAGIIPAPTLTFLGLGDIKVKEDYNRLDYFVVAKNPDKPDPKLSAQGDQAVGVMGRNRIRFADDNSKLTVMQKIRDICSRQ